jgi:hypothetical protein
VRLYDSARQPAASGAATARQLGVPYGASPPSSPATRCRPVCGGPLGRRPCRSSTTATGPESARSSLARDTLLPDGPFESPGWSAGSVRADGRWRPWAVALRWRDASPTIRRERRRGGGLRSHITYEHDCSSSTSGTSAGVRSDFAVARGIMSPTRPSRVAARVLSSGHVSDLAPYPANARPGAGPPSTSEPLSRRRRTAGGGACRTRAVAAATTDGVIADGRQSAGRPSRGPSPVNVPAAGWRRVRPLLRHGRRGPDRRP